MRSILIFALVPLVFGYDIIEEFLRKTINRTADPCDDFYRHVCPLGTPDGLLETLVIGHLENERTPGIWDEFEIINDFNEEYTDFAETIPLVAEKICKDGYDTTEVLEKIGHLFGESYMHLAYDSNCERVTQFIRDRIQDSNPLNSLDSYNDTLHIHLKNVRVISFHLDQNLEDAIAEMNTMTEEAKEVVAEWISDTPWANNNNVTDLTSEALHETALNIKYAKIMRDSLDILTKAEFEYRNCKQEYGNDRSAISFCFLYTMDPNFTPLTDDDLNFFPYLNAFNAFPELGFGFPAYYVAKNSNEYAGKAGFLGSLVGHEISHTLIKGRNDEVLPYFSEESVECIQNQYNESCKIFKEESCTVDDVQIDENGADILGVQIMYQLLENYYGLTIKDTYKPLDVTYQQLFFYAQVIIDCSGRQQSSPMNEDGTLNEHSAGNIRTNALVNHPAFQEAFECKEESRMMQSATEQCVIYGKDAPENKRH